jgi:hypothetical protein
MAAPQAPQDLVGNAYVPPAMGNAPPQTGYDDAAMTGAPPPDQSAQDPGDAGAGPAYPAYGAVPDSSVAADPNAAANAPFKAQSGWGSR